MTYLGLATGESAESPKFMRDEEGRRYRVVRYEHKAGEATYTVIAAEDAESNRR